MADAECPVADAARRASVCLYSPITSQRRLGGRWRTLTLPIFFLLQEREGGGRGRNRRKKSRSRGLSVRSVRRCYCEVAA
jgi:hypothetical protein